MSEGRKEDGLNVCRYAPLVIFAFNRLESLKAAIESLRLCPEARESKLFVFVDAARPGVEGEEEKVEAVRIYAKAITGFQTIRIESAKENKGLGPSIISGVSKVMDEYGRAIVLEDDLVLSPSFLTYMNQGLDRYENCPEVFSICGYSDVVKMPRGYNANTYFCPRSSSWGWATWKDRWESVDWELSDWNQVYANRRLFNRWAGSDCYGMLLGWKEGRNKSWAIRFCYAQFVQKKLSLFPNKSLVMNDGFDGSGTNCKKWSRFKSEFNPSGNLDFVYPNDVTMNPKIRKSALSYYSIRRRALGKIMNMIYR